MTPEEIIKEIIRIMNLPGEDNTDGECIDLVAELLTDNGWEVFK